MVETRSRNKHGKVSGASRFGTARAGVEKFRHVHRNPSSAGNRGRGNRGQETGGNRGQRKPGTDGTFTDVCTLTENVPLVLGCLILGVEIGVRPVCPQVLSRLLSSEPWSLERFQVYSLVRSRHGYLISPPASEAILSATRNTAPLAATTTDKCPTKRYTNIPLGTKDRSGNFGVATRLARQ